MPDRLLDAFTELFDGKPYLHRISTHGDRISVEVYEDLYELARSKKLVQSVDGKVRGVGPQNRAVTLNRMRRGDGTLGELLDPRSARTFPNYAVARGAIATIDCGIEVKILNKAMIKQIDRVVNDLEKQVVNWKRISQNVVSLAIVAINRAESTVGYERDRAYRTDGKDHKHPFQEAATAEAHIIERIVNKGIYDEVLLLRYEATNEHPFRFKWHNKRETTDSYKAALIRTSSLIDDRI